MLESGILMTNGKDIKVKVEGGLETNELEQLILEIVDKRLGELVRNNARTLAGIVIAGVVSAFSLGGWIYMNTSRLDAIDSKGGSAFSEAEKVHSRQWRKLELNLRHIMDKLGVEPVKGIDE